MNETIHPHPESDSLWPIGDRGVRVPDTSMLPGSEQAPPAAVRLLRNAVRSAHDTIDRLAFRASPAVRRVGEGVAAAGETLDAKSEQLREKRDEWAESVRGTVRSNPLAAMAAALAVGLLIARITR